MSGFQTAFLVSAATFAGLKHSKSGKRKTIFGFAEEREKL